MRQPKYKICHALKVVNILKKLKKKDYLKSQDFMKKQLWQNLFLILILDYKKRVL